MFPSYHIIYVTERIVKFKNYKNITMCSYIYISIEIVLVQYNCLSFQSIHILNIRDISFINCLLHIYALQQKRYKLGCRESRNVLTMKLIVSKLK